MSRPIPAYALDTNIIIRDPTVLSYIDEGAQILIPQLVIFELASVAKRKDLKKVLDLAFTALDHGAKSIDAPVYAVMDVDSVEGVDMAKLSRADVSIAETVRWYSSQVGSEQDVRFVTEDKALAEYARARGIPTIDLKTLKNELERGPEPVPSLLRRAQELIRQQRIAQLSLVVLGFLLGLLSNIIGENLSVILQRINVWGTIISVPILGFLLFFIRSRYRLAYGIAEIWFGFYLGLRPFLPEFEMIQLEMPTTLVQLVGGLYVIVRGLSNIDKGITGRPFEAQWRRVFPPQ